MPKPALRVVNTFPAGRVTSPVTTPPENRRLVTVSVQWNDGRTAEVPGVTLSVSPEATLVELVGPDGRRRREWFLAHFVRRR